MPEDDAENELADEIDAMAVWETHLKHATERWHEGVERSGEEYRQGLADAMGVDPEDVPDEAVEHWKEGVMETGPDEFAAAISGAGVDWLVGLYEGTTGKEPTERVRETAREVERAAVERAGDDASDEEIAAAVQEEIQRRSGVSRNDRGEA